MPYMLGVPAAIAGQSVPVEVVPGWETRGNASFNPAAVVCHWTAGPITGDRPSLKICVEGRPGLPGPLSQVFLTRGGVAVVVAAGRANHAGVGGWRGVVGNSAAFGIEAESAARSLSRVAMITRPARVPRTPRAAAIDSSRNARHRAYMG